jgi:hypothetical protein
VDVAERDRRPAHVAGVRRREQPGAEHLRGLGERGLLGGQVQGGARNEVPQPRHRLGALSVGGEPFAERALVEHRVVGIHTAQRQRRAHRTRAVGRAQVAIPGERAPEVQRRREARAPQPRDRPAGRQHRNVQPALQRGQPARPQPVEQGDVVGAAAQIHVLAVVEP